MVPATLAAVWFFWRPALPSEYRHIKLQVRTPAGPRQEGLPAPALGEVEVGVMLW
jgi:hypothetical protein